MGNSIVDISFYLVPLLPQTFILGVDFYRKLKLKIDFETNCWTSLNNRNSVQNLSIVQQPLNLDGLYPLETLTPDQKKRFAEVIASYKRISDKTRLGRTSKLTLSIDTGSVPPIRQRQYPMSPYMLNALNSELDEMLSFGVIEPSSSPWCSPVLLVKKRDGSYCLCFDGRKLTEVTKHDAYPLPRVDRVLAMLKNAKYISSVDLRKAFWQIPLDPSSREKIAFAVPGRGLFHFCVVPFGLRNAAQTQQRLMDALFGPEFEPHVFAYLDDIIIVSENFEEHVRLLQEVRSRLESANLSINPEKCEFF